MADLWVVNASPLISLAKIDKLDLFIEIGNEIILPEAVVSEVLQGSINDPARKALESGWGQNRIKVENSMDIIEWGLGSGETAVLSFAKLKNATAVIDDKAARTAAKVLGINVIGTLGIILLCQKRGLIKSAEEEILSLKKSGLFIETQLINNIMRNMKQ